VSYTPRVKLPDVYERLWDDYRYKIMYGGRGAARSWTIGRNLLMRGRGKPLRILCTRELQKSIKQSVHRLLNDQIGLLDLRGFYDVQQQGIYGANGTEFMFLGVKANPEEIRSTEGIDICWIEEGHSLSEASWDIIDPTIRKDGSEIWVSFNTRFRFDHVFQLFAAGVPPPRSLVLKTSYLDNPYLPQVLWDQLLHMKATDYEKFLHVWGGELKKLAEGAIFGKQVAQVHRDGRLCFVPIEKNCETMTFFDLGKNDETAIWFVQRVGQEYRFIDYFQGRLEEVEYYTQFVRSRSYLYSMHFMPHDADHDRLGMKRNIKQQFQDGGVRPVKIVPRIQIKNTALELGRDIFPKCWFHLGKDINDEEEHCDGYYKCNDPDMRTRSRRMVKGYEALCNYRYKYSEDDDVYHNSPHHDWASNGADAFLQFAQSNLTITDHAGHDWNQAVNT